MPTYMPPISRDTARLIEIHNSLGCKSCPSYELICGKCFSNLKYKFWNEPKLQTGYFIQWKDNYGRNQKQEVTKPNWKSLATMFEEAGVIAKFTKAEWRK